MRYPETTPQETRKWRAIILAFILGVIFGTVAHDLPLCGYDDNGDPTCTSSWAD